MARWWIRLFVFSLLAAALTAPLAVAGAAPSASLSASGNVTGTLRAGQTVQVRVAIRHTGGWHVFERDYDLWPIPSGASAHFLDESGELISVASCGHMEGHGAQQQEQNRTHGERGGGSGRRLPRIGRLLVTAPRTRCFERKAARAAFLCLVPRSGRLWTAAQRPARAGLAAQAPRAGGR